MAARFQNIDRETPMLLPASIQEWVPDNDPAHFIIDAVAALDLAHCSINHRGTGDAQFPPAMMLTLLIYCYATGLFSSRRIEHASYQNLSVRFICANTHPDHDTIGTFRRQNDALIKEAFLKTLLLARELKLLKVGTVAIDGTKVLANASKHAAKDQYNYTGPDSRIMKTGSGFEQSYNAQLAVEIDSRLIVGGRVSDAPNDKEQLTPTLAAVIRKGHHRTVTDLEKQDGPPPPGPQATAREPMIHRTATQAGKTLYKQRQQTVEPVIGIIKSAMGFRQFLLRGQSKVSLEWSLVTPACNFRRLHLLGMRGLITQSA